jgi:hypothetical protein
MASHLFRRVTAGVFFASALGAATSSLLAAETAPDVYAGQSTRAIKSLSQEEASALLAGQGSGFAKAAELNGYPGPAHVLELASQLGLDPTQLAATQALMSEHRRRARKLGADLVAAEAELDALFADRQARAASVDDATQRIASLQAGLRAEHLKTHLLETALLTPAQIDRYAFLRGYRPAAANAAPPLAEPTPAPAHPHHEAGQEQ